MNLKEYNLGDLILLSYGKALKEEERVDGDFPVYGSSGVVGTHNKYLTEGPSIIVGRKGNVGSIHWEEQPFYPIDTTYFVQLKEQNVLDLRYLFYKMKTLGLSKLNFDAAVPGLNREVAYKVKCKIHPSLENQSEIASILRSYDELISINQRRIKLLEESARLTYKEWFIYFRFPGHDNSKFINGVPGGWIKGKLEDLIYLNYGKALKAENRIDGEFPVYGSSGVVGNHEKFLVEGPAIIVGRKGNVGSCFWSNENFYPIDTVYYIEKSKSNFFAYQLIKGITFQNNDAAVPGLNRDIAHSIKVLIPPHDLISKYEDQVAPFFDLKQKLEQQNKKLASARDLLLPRLMNGDIIL